MNLVKLSKNEGFFDPVHGFINVEYKVIYDLIHSKEVQRLKHVKHLGGTMQVFPTAEHSRFAHSLGTYEMARQMIELSSVGDGKKLMQYLIMIGRADNKAQNPEMTAKSLKMLDKMEKMTSELESPTSAVEMQ